MSKPLVEFGSKPMILDQVSTIAPSLGQMESSLHDQFLDGRVADHEKNILLSHGCRPGRHKHISKLARIATPQRNFLSSSKIAAQPADLSQIEAGSFISGTGYQSSLSK